MYDPLIWPSRLHEKRLVISGNDEQEIHLSFLFFNTKSHRSKLLKKEMLRFCNNKIGRYASHQGLCSEDKEITRC